MVERIHKHLPKNKLGRTIIGVIFIILGFFGFLPILGYWMILVGLAILAFDFEFARAALRKIRDALTWLRIYFENRRAGRT